MNLRTRFIYASMLVGVVAIVGAIFYGIKSGLTTPGAEVVNYTPGLYGSENITAGGENVVLAASGNVSIGTTTPYSGTGVTSLTINAVSYPSLALQSGGKTKGLLSVAGDSVRLNSADTGGPVLLNVEGGNVGIGTTDPQRLLDIKSPSAYIARFQSTSPLGPSIAFSNSSNQIATLGAYSAMTATGTDMTPTLFSETGLGINFATGGNVTRRMVIDSNGNVGIGTTNLKAKLEVDGNAIITGNLDIFKGSLTAYGIKSTNKEFINYFAGNVGIGTTNPQAKLDVYGSAYFRDVSLDILNVSEIIKSDFIQQRLNTFANGIIECQGGNVWGYNGCGIQLYDLNTYYWVINDSISAKAVCASLGFFNPTIVKHGREPGTNYKKFNAGLFKWVDAKASDVIVRIKCELPPNP